MINIFIFSIMSPIGAFTGFVAQSAVDENMLIVAVLNGLSAGTLLFVAFFEVGDTFPLRFISVNIDP